MKWLIKNPAPHEQSNGQWGDTYFIYSLSRALRSLGHRVVIEFSDDWYTGTQSDIVLVLRGKHFYERRGLNQSALHILWAISHPEDISDNEIASYDLVCVASSTHAEQIEKRLPGQVFTLYQCTDTEIFFPPSRRCNMGSRSGVVFVGNTRGQVRDAITELASIQPLLQIIGKGWVKQHLGSLVLKESIENRELGDLYRRARMTLNDHWPDMVRYGYLNNRVFDALACGLPVLTDAHPAIERLFGSSSGVVQVMQGRFRDAYADAVLKYPVLLEEASNVAEKVRRDHSFMTRARQLEEFVKLQ